LRPQSLGLLLRQDEHEVRRKAIEVAPYLLVESPSWDLVERGQIAVKEDLATSDEEDAPLRPSLN